MGIFMLQKLFMAYLKFNSTGHPILLFAKCGQSYPESSAGQDVRVGHGKSPVRNMETLRGEHRNSRKTAKQRRTMEASSNHLPCPARPSTILPHLL